MLVNASEVSLQIITYGPFVARSLISVLLSPTLHCPLPSVFLCLDIQVSFGIWGMFPFCVDFGAQRLRSFHLVDLAPEVCFSPSILLVSSLDQHVARLYWFLGAYNQAKLHMSKQFFLPLCKDRPSLYVMFQRRRGYSLDSNSDKLSSGLHFFLSFVLFCQSLLVIVTLNLIEGCSVCTKVIPHSKDILHTIKSSTETLILYF